MEEALFHNLPMYGGDHEQMYYANNLDRMLAMKVMRQYGLKIRSYSISSDYGDSSAEIAMSGLVEYLGRHEIKCVDCDPPEDQPYGIAMRILFGFMSESEIESEENRKTLGTFKRRFKEAIDDSDFVHEYESFFQDDGHFFVHYDAAEYQGTQIKNTLQVLHDSLPSVIPFMRKEAALHEPTE